MRKRRRRKDPEEVWEDADNDDDDGGDDADDEDDSHDTYDDHDDDDDDRNKAAALQLFRRLRGSRTPCSWPNMWLQPQRASRHVSIDNAPTEPCQELAPLLAPQR